jgi:hypothetical protein
VTCSPHEHFFSMMNFQLLDQLPNFTSIGAFNLGSVSPFFFQMICTTYREVPCSGASLYLYIFLLKITDRELLLITKASSFMKMAVIRSVFHHFISWSMSFCIVASIASIFYED